MDLEHSQDLLKRLKASVFPIWFYFAVTAGKHFSKPGTEKLLPFGAGNQLVVRILFSWAPKSLRTVTTTMKLKDTCSLKGNLTHLDSLLKSRDITLLTKVHVVKAMGFQ